MIIKSAETTNALQGYHDLVVDFVNKLFDISMLIRKASGNFRTSRSAAHMERDTEGNVLSEFKVILDLKIKGLYRDTPLWLVRRLTDVITKRRQHFYYQKAHSRRRHKVPSLSLSAPTITSNPAIETDRPDLNKHDIPLTAPKLPPEARTTARKSSMKTYTTASEPILDDEESITQPCGKPTLTEMRMKESMFPSPPETGEHNTFQCYQCFERLPEKMRNPRLWRFPLHFLD
jgi:hypothetical protein